MRDHFPLPAQQPNPADVGENDDDGDWIGRLIVLRSLPDDPSLPERNHLIHVTEFEQLDDALVLEAGAPTPYTRIAWDASEALPFELHLPSTTALANIVPASAGETFFDYFVIGRGANGALPDQVTHAVERAGICNELTEERTVTYLHSLSASETLGLGWLGELRKAAPEIELLEADPATLDPLVPPREWTFTPSLLEAGSQERFFTLENGTWKTIFEVERFGQFVRHEDYASQAGFTIRFGDGEFGVTPPEQTVFRARYLYGRRQERQSSQRHHHADRRSEFHYSAAAHPCGDRERRNESVRHHHRHRSGRRGLGQTARARSLPRRNISCGAR